MQFQTEEITYNDFLVDQFKRLFQSFATIYNLEEKRSGSVFQKRFKRILIKDEYRWRHILAYIHHNPIHHNFRKEYYNWKFSSYLVFLSNLPTLVSREQVLLQFKESLENAKHEFIELHDHFKLEKEMESFYLDKL